jgi:2'-5' RNA ligase
VVLLCHFLCLKWRFGVSWHQWELALLFKEVMQPLAGAGQKGTLTTLAIVVPDHWINTKINAVRSLYDPSYPQWMPHVKLVHPFVECALFPVVCPKLQEALSPIRPFEVVLSELGSFPCQSGESVHFRIESDELQQVFAAVVDAVAWTRDTEFKPHLTIGQTHPTTASLPKAGTSPSKDIATTAEALKRLMLDEYRFTVEEVCLLARPSDSSAPFEIIHKIPLGAPLPTRQMIHRAPVLASRDLDAVKQLALNVVAKKVTGWLNRCRTGKGVPRTRPALERLIGTFSVRLQMDVDTVIEKLKKGLLRDTVIKAKQGETIRYYCDGKYRRKIAKGGRAPPTAVIRAYRKTGDVPAYEVDRKRIDAIPSTAPVSNECATDPATMSSRVSSWFKRAVRGWRQCSDGNYVVKASVLHKALKEILAVKVHAPASDVVEQLIRDGVVAIDNDGALIF